MNPSRLCMGTLTLSPLQKNVPAEKAAQLMAYAFASGITFFDTAELYSNYSFFKELWKLGVPRGDVTVSTKCYAYSRETAHRSLEKALKEMNTDYIDVFLLHEQESIHTLRGHAEAIDTFWEYKEQCVIGSLGISTHYVAGVRAACTDERLQVIHPIINVDGIGIVDGSAEEMVQAMQEAKELGKFIFAMKALGGGHLLKRYREALAFILGLSFVDAIAVGMATEEEIDANVHAIMEERLPPHAVEKDRGIFIEPYCIGCGACVARCQQKALSIKDGKAVVDSSRCVLCSYCVRACKDFYIKVL